MLQSFFASFLNLGQIFGKPVKIHAGARRGSRGLALFRNTTFSACAATQFTAQLTAFTLFTHIPPPSHHHDGSACLGSLWENCGRQHALPICPELPRSCIQTCTPLREGVLWEHRQAPPTPLSSPQVSWHPHLHAFGSWYCSHFSPRLFPSHILSSFRPANASQNTRLLNILWWKIWHTGSLTHASLTWNSALLTMVSCVLGLFHFHHFVYLFLISHTFFLYKSCTILLS